MSDNPVQNSTIARLSAAEKLENGGPYVYLCRNGKDQVTFPDLAKMDWIDAETFMEDMQTKKESAWMRKHLSADDFDRLLAEKWKTTEFVLVAKDIVTHYQTVFGTPGESDASRT